MDELSEIAFVIIKPDAIERGLVGRLITRFEETYLRVMALQERHKSPEWAMQHYAHLHEKEFFPQLVKFMTFRSVVSMNVVGPHAIQRLRAIAGATCPWEAAPGTIRGDLGHFPAMYNLVHVSESIEAADRERALFYNTVTDVVVGDDDDEESEPAQRI